MDEKSESPSEKELMQNSSQNNLVKKDNEENETKYVTGYLIIVACVCFFGSSLQFGYNLSDVNAPEPVSTLLFLRVF